MLSIFLNISRNCLENNANGIPNNIDKKHHIAENSPFLILILTVKNFIIIINKNHNIYGTYAFVKIPGIKNNVG